MNRKLRFILKRRIVDPSGVLFESFETVDAYCPKLSEKLTRGGFGNGSDSTDLVGAEVLGDENP